MGSDWQRLVDEIEALERTAMTGASDLPLRKIFGALKEVAKAHVPPSEPDYSEFDE